MPSQKISPSYYILFLVIPTGISSGFIAVTLPWLLTAQKGFSVADTAIVVSTGLSANLWRFLWGPIADFTLSLRKWYFIALIACVASLFLLCFMPYSSQHMGVAMGMVFLSQVASTLVMLPVGGFMAHCIHPSKKGMAGGWFQAGNLGGMGLGGGVGLWLANHWGMLACALVLSVTCILSGLIVLLMDEVPSKSDASISKQFIVMGKDVLEMLKTPVIVFVILLICMPLGTGAVSNLWSAVAVDWHVGADEVALVTGILSSIVSAIGCIAGGYVADKWGKWFAYLSSGLLCALVTIAIALFPKNHHIFFVGVLGYSFSLGCCYAAFSALLLFAIGKKNAATKYAMLSSLGNLPVVYMISLVGWAHDQYGNKPMLYVEALPAIFFVLICVPVIMWMKKKGWVQSTVS
jgi:MFS family permease